MLEFIRSKSSSSNMAVLKGSNSVSFQISMPYSTPFGISYANAVKNITHEEAIKLRDYLNDSYPINYVDVIDVEFTETLNKDAV